MQPLTVTKGRKIIFRRMKRLRFYSRFVRFVWKKKKEICTITFISDKGEFTFKNEAGIEKRRSETDEPGRSQAPPTGIPGKENAEKGLYDVSVRRTARRFSFFFLSFFS